MCVWVRAAARAVLMGARAGERQLCTPRQALFWDSHPSLWYPNAAQHQVPRGDPFRVTNADQITWAEQWDLGLSL